MTLHTKPTPSRATAAGSREPDETPGHAWQCTSCGLPQTFQPTATLLGGYGEGHCPTCHKRTVWESVDLKEALRAS